MFLIACHIVTTHLNKLPFYQKMHNLMENKKIYIYLYIRSRLLVLKRKILCSNKILKRKHQLILPFKPQHKTRKKM